MKRQFSEFGSTKDVWNPLYYEWRVVFGSREMFSWNKMAQTLITVLQTAIIQSNTINDQELFTAF